MSVYSEYFNLEKDANSILRGVIKNYELQICSIVTFGCPTVYYIYRNSVQDNNLRVVQWNKYLDLEITQNPLVRLKYVGKTLKPTIVQKEIDCLNEEKLGNLLFRFSRLNIPKEIKDSRIKLDGTTYEVSLFKRQDQNHLRYVWWENAPDEWKDLEALMLETINFFREQSRLKGWIYFNQNCNNLLL
jgi:hypothetical protein